MNILISVIGPAELLEMWIGRLTGSIFGIILTIGMIIYIFMRVTGRLDGLTGEPNKTISSPATAEYIIK